jgi:carbamate kinase
MARIVVALGGNALQQDGESDAQNQKNAARQTARQLVNLIKEGRELTIAHGNGPQVGAILLNEETASKIPSPLDTCVAMSQGEIGYWLQQALANELRTNAMQTTVATVVTQIVVSVDDPAFSNPTKPIGPFYPNEQTALAAAAERQFVVKEDAGRGWRRVVASPQPIDIVEKVFITQAITSGHVVIAAGGGGIPVVDKNNEYVGVEAVIDKDFAAERLAELIQETVLNNVSVADMEKHVADGQFAPGSMLPKVQAALRFVKSGDSRRVIITSPLRVDAALRGETGTTIRSNE